jgi:predicted AlkP superfamily pyrophosphatase or phosphodiesterase
MFAAPIAVSEIHPDPKGAVSMLRRSGLLVVLACLALAGARAQSHEDPPYVVVISIDGLMPTTYTTAGPARIPALRQLAAGGAWATGVIGVLPSVTYPSHTSMITGVLPAQHGIVDNRIFDPQDRSRGGWHWYADEIRVPTLPGAVRGRGLRAGAVSWPVTIGMDLDYLVPEYMPSEHPISLLLLGALSKPAHLLNAAEIDLDRRLPWPLTDRDRLDLAIHILRRHRPHLLLLHMFESDSAQHDHGPGSSEAAEAIERLDGYVALLLREAETSGLAGRLNVALVSDHGFLPTTRELHPNTAFREQGWVTVDASGKVSDWRVWFHRSGGSGFVYLRSPDDTALRTEVRNLLQRLAHDPANGIAHIWSAEDLARLGAHPDAAFGIEMRPGFATGSGHARLLTEGAERGNHGFDPSRPELHASLILNGPRVPRVGNLGTVRMTQIAPTLAQWFGVGLSPHADRPLRLEKTQATAP